MRQHVRGSIAATLEYGGSSRRTETFESFHLNYTDIRELEDGRLLVIGTLHLRARGSGIETDVPTAAIATEREGLLIEWIDYGDVDKALEAAGLPE